MYTHLKENFMENKLCSYQIFINALLFEKTWNKCKNPSFLHKATCIESDHGSTKMRSCFSTFMALYCRRLCRITWRTSEATPIMTREAQIFIGYKFLNFAKFRECCEPTVLNKLFKIMTYWFCIKTNPKVVLLEIQNWVNFPRLVENYIHFSYPKCDRVVTGSGIIKFGKENENVVFESVTSV